MSKEQLHGIMIIRVPPVRAEKPVQGSGQQSCHLGRLTVMITGHVPAVRLPPDHADRRMAAAIPARGGVADQEILILRHQLAVLQRRQPCRPKLTCGVPEICIRCDLR